VALSLSPDGKTLYTALAGDNAVSVLDVSGRKPRVKGYIPTERYPSAVSVSPDGRSIAVATAKGFYGPNAGSGVKLDGPQIRGDEGIKF
ncbi:beta-propeller fold lactonase family protein, partial [Acinetobacter baumannii]